MRERVTTAVVGIMIAGVIVYFSGTVVLNITVSLISTLAVYELLKAVDITKFKAFTAVSLLFAAAMPLTKVGNYKNVLLVFSYTYIIVAFLFMLKYHKALKVEQVAFAIMATLFLPLSFATIIYTRDIYGSAAGIFFMVYGLVAAWLADIGGLFFGMLFGKTKLCPEISPKKTVEGAVGGFLFSFMAVILFAFLFESFSPTVFGLNYRVNYMVVALSSPVLTALSIVGDLMASVVKRQHSVKDYGSIMPGHGGIMDRFDSTLFVFPLLYIMFNISPIITAVQL